MNAQQEILAKIHAFINHKGISAFTFGKEALGDPNLVYDLEKGRELRSATLSKIRDYIEKSKRKRGANA